MSVAFTLDAVAGAFPFGAAILCALAAQATPCSGDSPCTSGSLSVSIPSARRIIAVLSQGSTQGITTYSMLRVTDSA